MWRATFGGELVVLSIIRALRYLISQIGPAPVANIALHSPLTLQLRVVLGQPETRAFLTANESLLPEFSSDRDAFLLLVLPALGQAHILEDAVSSGSHASLLGALARVEEAYDVLGGLAGYQRQCLRLLVREQSDSCGPSAGVQSVLGQTQEASSSPESTTSTPHLRIPSGLRLDASDPRAALEAKRAVMAGIRATPRVAELWPVGGCADRLGLRCPATGEPLPAALRMLRTCEEQS